MAAGLVGHVGGALGPQDVFDAASSDKPWADRPHVTLQADADTKIGDLVNQGAVRLGLSYPTGTWFSDNAFSWAVRDFVFDGENFGLRYAKFDAVLNGSVAQWWFDSDNAKLKDAFLACDAGLLLGDPRHLYVVIDEPEKPAGNGVDYWLAVVENLPYLKQYLEAAGIVGSVASGVKGVGKVFSLVRDRYYTSGATLGRYRTLFAIPRTTAQVAALVDLPESEVPALCHFLGMRHVDGAWRPDNQPSAKEYRELVQVVDAMSHWQTSHAVRMTAFGKILAIPSGSRVKQMDAIVRSLLYQDKQGGQGELIQ